MADFTVSVVGGSGYVGGELIRLLLSHHDVELRQVTSETHAGKPLARLHPNLRKRTTLKFAALSDLIPCDTLFLCLPHGEAMKRIGALLPKAERLIDLSADFRLGSADTYADWYGATHHRPDLLDDFVYGIPELHRGRMREARLISSAGCNATATILALYPLYLAGLVGDDRVVVEVKTGSSEGGASATSASHHPERSGCVRSYSPTGHRHTAEILQELGPHGAGEIHFSATSVEIVRGVLATCHVFVRSGVDTKAVWGAYRDAYSAEPFIRFVAESQGIHRFPEPKLLSGSNYCDIGFELDRAGRRLVVLAALDNLMKGAAGQAVQAFNIMHGLEETAALDFPGLHPV